MGHVAGRVDVNEETDPGDHQDHQGRQRIDSQGEIHMKRTRSDPRPDSINQSAILGEA